MALIGEKHFYCSIFNYSSGFVYLLLLYQTPSKYPVVGMVEIFCGCENSGFSFLNNSWLEHSDGVLFVLGGLRQCSYPLH